MQEIRTYSPVVIPTLCRYEHFKRCLESLERCTGAEQTDVYVGLDFPPSENYVEGWRKIDVYLAEKERNNGFKNLYVSRRDHNCGVARRGSNASLIVEEIKEKYDRYIFSEDDNEFAPNFLEYMNKGLEKYKNNPRVIKISAYTAPCFSKLTTDTTFFGIDVSAYGVGSWFQKMDMTKFTNEEISKELHQSFFRTMKMFLTSPALINSATHMINGNHNYGDVRWSMYNLIKGTYVLCPTVSLSRNWGADGSGLHSGIVKGLEKNEIQTEKRFIIQDIPEKVPKLYRQRLFFFRMPKNIMSFIMHFCYALLYTLFFFLK